MPKEPIPTIPPEITSEQIDAWRNTLGIEKQEAAAYIGKAPNFWTHFLEGEKDLKLEQLNALLRMFSIRAEALRNQ